jgi:PAS domain S-box-containing protein
MTYDQRSLEQLLRDSENPLLLLNNGAVIQDINAPATRLLGGDRDDYVGREIFSLVDPADRIFFQERWQNPNAGVRTMRQFTVRLRRASGPSDWHTLRVETGDQPGIALFQVVRLEHLSITRTI